MDDELRAIREARLRELKQQSGGTSESANNGSNDGQTQAILNQILDSNAQERLSRVALVRPERVKAVEAYLLQMVRSGAIRNKLTEQDIVGILESVGRDEQKRNTTRIIFDRREKGTASSSVDQDDDEDDDFFD
ncbi:Sdd2p [Kluyveromyces lactis]|uniref:KLLA0F25850p n=1 Tax=Kluyveromyces lactis (strain ATCC 8585 / CBS 2359 / DSM 70799 / NBRC 1267 / NRRL Y-1140 / WM37) TaxID=284590 RepID=Q6CIK8_KLULA|nr:uncharacterized protein KLLA0_F25850g [Kluyveromyces lactis]CAG98939.1 KLLA0F25850p [Kluyveromyces lactis]|eukprot:XP_456231.1 uncharacterized protein KLLA0_F25850g [Kluyveromyces lactis]